MFRGAGTRWAIALRRLNIAFYRFASKSFVTAVAILTLDAFLMILYHTLDPL